MTSLVSGAIRGTCGRALVAAFVVGPAYGAAAWYSPLAPVSVALPVIAGAILGAWIANSAITCVLTRRSLVLAITMAAALLAVYLTWVANVSVRVPQWAPWTCDPRLLFAFAAAQYEHGGVHVENAQQVTTYRGGGLVAIWIAEAAAILATALLVAWKVFEHSAPAACAGCGGWQSVHYGFARRGLPVDVEAFAARTAAGDVTALHELPAGSIDDDPHVRVDIEWCSRCQDSCRTSVVVVSYTYEPGETWLGRRIEWPFAELKKLAEGDEEGGEGRDEGLDEEPGT